METRYKLIGSTASPYAIKLHFGIGQAREITLPNLACLVAAQPTRGLDVGAVAAVYRHIRAAGSRGVAILLVSSELDELLTVADRIVVLYRGRIMGSCIANPARRETIGAMMAGQPQ